MNLAILCIPLVLGLFGIIALMFAKTTKKTGRKTTSKAGRKTTSKTGKKTTGKTGKRTGKRKGSKTGRKTSGKTGQRTGRKGRTTSGKRAYRRTGGRRGRRAWEEEVQTPDWDRTSYDMKLRYFRRLYHWGELSAKEYRIEVFKLNKEKALKLGQTDGSIAKTKAKPQVKGSKKKVGKTTVKRKSKKVDKIRLRRMAKIEEDDDDDESLYEEDYDFEEDLREELGEEEDRGLSFEEELRRIAEIGKMQGAERAYNLESSLIKKTDKGQEYILPPITIFEAEFKEGPNIDEIFLMNKDGMLIRHFGFSKTSGIDEDILASMLMVIQNFISDSFSEKETDLKELHLGDFNILIHQGKLYFNAVVISSDDNLKSLEKSIEPMVREIEKINEDKLDDWNGDLDEFKGIKDCIAKLINNQY